MASALKYDYMDQTIDEGLKCAICHKPFIDPICTSCRHAFCRGCFKDQIVRKSACPECNKPLSSKDVQPMVLFVCRMLDDLLVKCLGCEQTGIKRSQFNHHLAVVCPRALVKCSAADIRCPWQGRSNQLKAHQASCVYEQLREVLSELIAVNNELRKSSSSGQTTKSVRVEDAQRTSDRLAQQTNAIQQLQNEVNILQDVICHRNERLENAIKACGIGSPIDLRQQELTDLDMGIIIQKAIIDQQCTELQLQGNAITQAGVSLLARGLRNNTTLTKLNVSHNPIGDSGVCSLAQFLATNNNRVDRIYLCDIGMTDQGASYLVDMLKRNTTLASLGIFQNQLTDRGMRELFDALATHNNTLKNFYFALNSLVTDRSVDDLLRMLSRNQTLALVDIARCGLTPAGKRRLRQATSARPNFFLET